MLIYGASVVLHRSLLSLKVSQTDPSQTPKYCEEEFVAVHENCLSPFIVLNRFSVSHNTTHKMRRQRMFKYTHRSASIISKWHFVRMTVLGFLMVGVTPNHGAETDGQDPISRHRLNRSRPEPTAGIFSGRWRDFFGQVTGPYQAGDGIFRWPHFQ